MASTVMHKISTAVNGSGKVEESPEIGQFVSLLDYSNLTLTYNLLLLSEFVSMFFFTGKVFERNSLNSFK